MTITKTVTMLHTYDVTFDLTDIITVMTATWPGTGREIRVMSIIDKLEQWGIDRMGELEMEAEEMVFDRAMDMRIMEHLGK